LSRDCRLQGDQIGLISAQWAIAYFGSLKNTKVAQILGIFKKSIDSVSNFTKNGLGYILGDFFTNSSGRPVANLLKLCS
jgi:hypothetical protein